jgi:hypothetical protein
MQILDVGWVPRNIDKGVFRQLEWNPRVIVRNGVRVDAWRGITTLATKCRRVTCYGKRPVSVLIVCPLDSLEAIKDN